MAKALQLHHNSPTELQSPAHLVFNRPVRDGLPIHRQPYAPEWQRDFREIEERSIKAHTKKLLPNITKRKRPITAST